MRSVLSRFSAHPDSVGESYLEHMAAAWGFGARMLVGGLACLLHGLLPFLFVRTGSRIIGGLHDRMVVNRTRHDGRTRRENRAPRRPHADARGAGDPIAALPAGRT